MGGFRDITDIAWIVIAAILIIHNISTTEKDSKTGNFYNICILLLFKITLTIM